LPILVVPSKNVSDERLMQPSKAFSQMLVTEEGIVTEVKDVQSLKTPALISVIPLGIVIVARLWQPINAAFSMTADSGSVIEVRAVQCEYLQLAVFQCV